MGLALRLLSALLVLWCGAAPAAAKPGFSEVARTPPKHGLDALFDGWSSFSDGWLLLDMVLVLLLALALGAVIAYHPATRRRLSTLEHFEQPKTLLMYAVVAAVVALIVEVQPTMAFVIFGIGGLLRFRTMVGDAKDTGRVILVTVVGLCCGLKIFIVAIPATVIGWLLIYFLEQQIAGIIRISGVGEQAMQESSRAHRALIAQAGCAIIGEQTKFIKREFAFVVKAPPSLDRERLQHQFDALPPELRGAVDWERI
ncbi:MAG TPA: hypothetical protein VG937_05975 [Polyangiaceae bacterium]|jgi:hypothetical protein|nr:hypothetical protein [Polyangiaceae bacterium]